MAGKRQARPPDFDESRWKFEYCSDQYWDPKDGEIRFVKLKPPFSKKDQRIRKDLEPFWFAKSYKYLSQDGVSGGLLIRPYGQNECIKMWGLAGDEENWVQAVLTSRGWHLIKEGEKWEFGFNVAEDGSRLEALQVFLNDQLIYEY